ncbi:MAG: hypothetical protein ABJH04_08040 [Cyclobacteriaceae bacterium]
MKMLSDDLVERIKRALNFLPNQLLDDGKMDTYALASMLSGELKYLPELHVITICEEGINTNVDPKVFTNELLAGLYFQHNVTNEGFRSKEDSESWTEYQAAFSQWEDSGDCTYDKMDWEIQWFKQINPDDFDASKSSKMDKNGPLKLFQLRDPEEVEFALIRTNADADTCSSLLSDYFDGDALGHLSDEIKEEISYPDSINPDGFIEYLKYKGFQATRIVAEDVFS